MTALWIVTGAALLASLIASRQRTGRAVIAGAKLLLKIGPLLVGLIAVMSLILAALTPQTLQRLLGGTGPLQFAVALGVGSVALIPGFIAYPLAATLRQHGAAVGVIAAFITSLMMVGVITLPLEARFFGWRVALLRNLLALLGALAVATAMAWVLS